MAFKQGIFVADVIFTIVLIQPLGSFFWRGTWEVWGLYVKFDCVDPPGGNSSIPMQSRRISPMADECLEYTGTWVIGLISLFAETFFNCMAHLLQKNCTPETCTMPGFIIISRIYFLLFGFAYFGQWRGVWGLADYYTGDLGWRSNLLGLGVVYGITFLTRTSKMAMSTPWHSGFDVGEDVFIPRSWFRSKPKDGHWYYCLDQFLSMLIPNSLGVLVWRCYWNILDDVFLTHLENNVKHGISVGIGVGGQVIVMLLSFPASKLSKRLDREPLFFKVIWEDFFYILVNGTVVFIWYGMYGLISDNIYPDTEKGSWMCMAIGFGGLALLCSATSAFDNSVDIDGEDMDGEGVLPDVQFFSYWFRERIEAEEKDAKDQTPELLELKVRSEENGTSNGISNMGFNDGIAK